MSTVTPSLLSLVESTAETRLVGDDAQLAATLANSARHGLPPISITPLHGQHLSLLAQLVSARAVLEVGTLGGYSAQWFARAGARVTSIEVDARHRDVALENLRAAGVDGAEVVLGDALDVLPRLAAEGRVFDLVFVDADWGLQADYFDWAVRLTRRGGAIYVDNAVQSMVEDGEDGVTREGSLVARVGRDERVRAALVPTVSVRKWDCESEFVDGFLLAVVL
ncbi:O-methyltransferase, family 3 [Metarhizium guizhouense ARSEF 977]|uniref:O-methyltransferase, family 3 n=1 Tax=Metarhizium guizhouense (strain ARSEF 977) TaxID=1276136 RepID=A0A0B4H7X4_METGA|nr:O-methyltransferase, family 3 [Metarhizium guizhouense ARSEF 977]